ncbi:MAG: syntaxin of plants [Trebouxia sp. A1-2]|nr:MAG: syntaxin of plants [Trebouxia sp. A1-2]
MNDLLDTFRKNETPSRLYSAADLEAGPPPPEQDAANDKQMDAFFKEVAAIKVQFATIKEAQDKLLAAHDRTKTITRSADIMEIRETMQDDMNEVSRIAHSIKSRLEHLQRESRSASSTELQVVERRAHIVTGRKPSREEVDHLIDTGESESIFKKAILKQGRGHALDAMAEIQERHEAVRDLEQSLTGLQQIFLDMSVLVDAQGEMLDNIEQQVGKARVSVETGVTELASAKTYQKSSRRWMCWAAALVLVIAVVIVVAVVVAVKH